jgi:hypothetical protein
MTKFVNKQQNPLRIRIGDEVVIDFGHKPNDSAFKAMVTDIVGRADIGHDAMISYVRLDGKKDAPFPDMPDGCSVSHVISVVHGPYQTGPKVIQNIFREHLLEERKQVEESAHGWIGWYTFGGVRVGMKNSLVMAALAEATDELTRPYDGEKFKALWEKDGRPGQVASPDEEEYPSRRYLCVRWKTFKKWVLKNRHKLLMTRKEIEQCGRDYIEAMNESYMKDLDDEYDDRYDAPCDEDEQYAQDSRSGAYDDFDYGYDSSYDR